MPGPAVVFAAENLIEGIGLVVGVTDLTANFTAPTPGVDNIPTDAPYVRIERFSVSQRRSVVGDKLFATGVVVVGLGQLVDHTFYHGEGNLWYKMHFPSYGVTLKSSGGISARMFDVIHTAEETPQPRNSAQKTYEVQGSGAGGYIIEKLSGPDERPRRYRMHKICSEDTPIFRLPFEFTLEGREVGNERIWIEADVHGYESVTGEDAEREVEDVSEKLIVEITPPYEVVVNVQPRHIKHGENVECSLELTNRSFEKELSWETSTLDGDHRRGASLPPRVRGSNRRIINSWAEEHVGAHRCRGAETWVEGAFSIDPWQIEELHIDLERSPDWTHTWDGPAIPIDCERELDPLQQFLNWIRNFFNSSGRFFQRGSRTYWEPDHQEPEESGRNPDEPARPPMPGIQRQNGLRGTITPRRFVKADDIRLTLTGHRSREKTKLKVNEEGLFQLKKWPFEHDEGASLVIEAPAFRKRQLQKVSAGGDISATLQADLVQLNGQIIGEYAETGYRELRLWIREPEDPVDEWSAVVSEIGVATDGNQFVMGDVVRGKRMVLEARALTTTGIALTASREFTTKADITTIELELKPLVYTDVPDLATLSGRFISTKENRLILELLSGSRTLETLQISPNQKWKLPKLPTRTALRIRLSTEDNKGIHFITPVFQLLGDMEFPAINLDRRLDNETNSSSRKY